MIKEIRKNIFLILTGRIITITICTLLSIHFTKSYDPSFIIPFALFGFFVIKLTDFMFQFIILTDLQDINSKQQTNTNSTNELVLKNDKVVISQ